MRGVAKLSLLLTPLTLAATTGCATQSPRVAQVSSPQKSLEDRSSRLMRVAEQMERNGKPELAQRIYAHVIAQDPGNTLAQQRLKAAGTIDSRESSPLADRASRPMSQPQGEIRSATSPVEQARSTSARPSRAPRLEAVVAASAETSHDRPELSSTSSDQSHGPARLKDGSSVWGDEFFTPARSTQATATAAAEALADERRASQDGTSPGLTTAAPQPAGDWWALAFAPEPVPAQGQPQAGEWLPTGVRPHNAAASGEDAAASEPAVELTAAALAGSFGRPAEPESGELLQLCEPLSPELVPLVTRLESGSLQDRCDALFALGQMREAAQPAVLAIRALLDDRDPRVRSHAAGALRCIQGDAWDAVHILASLLSEVDVETVRFSTYLLGQMGPEAMDAVPQLESLRDSSADLTQLHAAEALVQIAPHDTASFEILVQGVTADDARLRWFAAMALGTVSPAQQAAAVSVLRQALLDTDATVRSTAALSLGGLGTSARVAIDDLTRVAEFDTPDVREAANVALACLNGSGPTESQD